MADNAIPLPDEIYSNYLQTIGNVRFSRREVDVMACLFKGRMTKKIAHILSISPKTVATHVRNIMLKLEANSREGIIDFIENSAKGNILQEYYVQLMVFINFEHALKKISTFVNSETQACSVVLWNNQGEKNSFVSLLETHLNAIGVKVDSDEIGGKKVGEFIESQKTPPVSYYIYFMSSDSTANQQLINQVNLLQSSRIFLFFYKNSLKEDISQGDYIDLYEQGNYYFLFFELLTKLFPTLDFQEIIANFKKDYEGNGDNGNGKFTIKENNKVEPERLLPPPFLVSRKKKKKGYFLTCGAVLSLCLIGLIAFVFQYQASKNSLDNNSIRSEFTLPSESTLLDRSELLAQLENTFTKGDGIQTVALVGIGGAGKTTLARQFVRTLNAPLIWEINAEKKESLISSFEELAHVVAKTAEDQKILEDILEMNNLPEREKKILFFVKNQLKRLQKWVLIYDNLETFNDVEKYFPINAQVWGNGEVIITTRNENVNNILLNPSHVINIKELTEMEKFFLFTRILLGKEYAKVNHSDEKEIKAFLKAIPSFPLDVSSAAYYLKSTNTPLKKYLEYIQKQDRDFIHVEEGILKETSDYTKTRYNIITLSLKKLVDTDKQFSDLMLFISLLDSQNIPKELLYDYKSGAIADNLIYHLKKYSLISIDPQSVSYINPTFSIHRSTQAISRIYFLKAFNSTEYKEKLFVMNDILKRFVESGVDGNDVKEYDITKLNHLIKHGEAFLVNSGLLNKNGMIKGSIITAAFLRDLGIIQRELGNFKKSKYFFQNSYDLFKNHEGAHSPEAAKTLGNLGVTYGFLGKYDQAKDCYQQALSVCHTHYGKNHIQTAWLSVHAGNTYRDLGQFEEAKRLYEQSYQTYKKHFGEDYLYAGWCLDNLGEVYRHLGYYEKARVLLEKSIKIYKNNGSKGRLGYAWAAMRLGMVFKALKDFKKARDYFEESLFVYKEYYDTDNIIIKKCLLQLGSVYLRLGHVEKAQALLEETLAFFKSHYGENHLNTAKAYQELAQYYLLKNDIKMANVLFQKAFVIFQQKPHPEFYHLLENLAEVAFIKAAQAQKVGKIEEARRFKNLGILRLKHALKVVEEHFPKDSPHLVRIQSKINNLSLFHLSPVER